MEQVHKYRDWRKWSGASSDEHVCCFKLGEKVFGRKCGPDSGLVAMAYLWRRFGPPFSGSDPYKQLASWHLTTDDPKVVLIVAPSGSELPLCLSYMKHKSAFKDEVKRQRQYEVDTEKIWFAKKGMRYLSHRKWLALPKRERDAIAKEFSDWSWSKEGRKEIVAKLGRYPRATGDDPESKALVATLEKAMRDLLRPVMIRDVPVNVLGRVPDEVVTLRTNPDGETEIDAVPASPYAGFGVPKQAMDKMLKAR